MCVCAHTHARAFVHVCVCVCVFVYIYIYTYISVGIWGSFCVRSSACYAAGTDIPDPLSWSVSIIHRSRYVFKATSCIGTELLYIGSSWSSCICSSMWKGPLEDITYEFVLTSPAVSRMSGSFNLDSFRNGW